MLREERDSCWDYLGSLDCNGSGTRSLMTHVKEVIMMMMPWIQT